ncbi:hypothetical protein FACS189418_4530 [Clostridia bacterium]|nr:hypothetical protein FACS189418_4530 [Clostridia bacterium]
MFYQVLFSRNHEDISADEITHIEDPDAAHLKELDYPEWFRSVMGTGKIENWENVKFYYHSRRTKLNEEYLINSYRCPIVHKKVIDVLKQEGIQGIEALSLSLIDQDSQLVNENYALLNILNFIEAYDMSKSKYMYIDKYQFYSFLPEDIVLDQKVCESFDIFRCKQDKMRIYVSEKVKNIIEKNSWQGFLFQKYPTNDV